MAAPPAPPPPAPPGHAKRLLLVSADRMLVAAATEAGRLLGAPVDVLPTLDAAMAWLLHPRPSCTHVLVSADLAAADIDALAGMVDELSDQSVPVLLLGSAHGAGRSIIGVDPPEAEAIVRAVRADAAPRPPPAMLDAETLRTALHEGMLRVRFQPVLDAISLRMLGAEALARLHHPRLGILQPGQFIQSAIETGQDRMLSHVAAARATMDMRNLGFPASYFIAFNVPLPTFLRAGAAGRARDICAIAGLAVDRAVIEVVETMWSPDMRALAAAVIDWREAGFLVTVDDAGPRLPHWRQLLELPFTGVKLDGALAGPGEAAGALAEEIVGVARRHGHFVIAEGIEDEASLARMRALGVDAVQGYMYCRPLPARALRIWASAWEALRGGEE